MMATRQLFQHELDALRERIVTMGSMVDKALGVSEPVDSEAPAQGSSEHED